MSVLEVYPLAALSLWDEFNDEADYGRGNRMSKTRYTGKVLTVVAGLWRRGRQWRARRQGHQPPQGGQVFPDHDHRRDVHVPLESPVPEIGTPGSESGERKRAHGPRIAARCESAGSATDALPATRLPSTLPTPPVLRVSPAARGGRQDEVIQAVAVVVPSGWSGSDERDREGVVGMVAATHWLVG